MKNQPHLLINLQLLKAALIRKSNWKEIILWMWNQLGIFLLLISQLMNDIVLKFKREPMRRRKQENNISTDLPRSRAKVHYFFLCFHLPCILFILIILSSTYVPYPLFSFFVLIINSPKEQWGGRRINVLFREMQEPVNIFLINLALETYLLLVLTQTII